MKNLNKYVSVVGKTAVLLGKCMVSGFAQLPVLISYMKMDGTGAQRYAVAMQRRGDADDSRADDDLEIYN